MGRGHERRRSTSPRRGVTHGLGDLEEPLLLAAVLLQHLVEVDIFGIAALNLGGLDLGLLLTLDGLLGSFLGLVTGLSVYSTGGSLELNRKHESLPFSPFWYLRLSSCL